MYLAQISACHEAGESKEPRKSDLFFPSSSLLRFPDLHRPSTLGPCKERPAEDFFKQTCVSWHEWYAALRYP